MKENPLIEIGLNFLREIRLKIAREISLQFRGIILKKMRKYCDCTVVIVLMPGGKDGKGNIF